MNATKRCWIDPLDRGHYHRRQTKIRQESSRGKNSQRRNHTAAGLRLVAAVQWQSLKRARAWDPGSEGTARNRRVSGVMHWNPSRAAWRCRMRSRTKNPRKRSGMPRQETPRCAMANWGLAMTEYHQLWEPYAGPTELQRGSAEIQRARVLKPGTPREKDYAEALGVFYDGWEQRSHAARAMAYRDAMRGVHERNPKHQEAAICSWSCTSRRKPLWRTRRCWRWHRGDETP